VPTANVETRNELIPPHGVYATTAMFDGVVLPSVTNIGVRPTFESTSKTVIETHILNFGEDVYGKPIRLGFVQRMRDERRFPDVDALKAQVEADVRRAGRLFDRLSV
jgi:riboflavin kinase/FMN adenylyltransferase